ncbi:UNVERIFIED_CONTAM: hypothetical protein Sradi_5045800 [Sesamum radiatum]|uniref:Uncharacterized protein n=1 Tax=Sesamum radiatum TaxID=300843 RepID=A0AAW2LZY6_SESRA
MSAGMIVSIDVVFKPTSIPLNSIPRLFPTSMLSSMSQFPTPDTHPPPLKCKPVDLFPTAHQLCCLLPTSHFPHALNLPHCT